MSNQEISDTAEVWPIEELVEALDLMAGPQLEKAVRYAHQLGMGFAPQWIGIIEKATECAAVDDLPGNAHTIALFLLTELRAKQALPAIIKSFSLNSDQLDVMWGDVTTELLPRILAALADGQIDLIDSLIANKSIDEYVRWSAASSFVLLVRDGAISRAEAITRLRAHLDRTITELDRGNSCGLVLALESLAAADALDAIKEVFRLELIPTMLMSLELVEENIASGDAYIQAEFERYGPTGIPDAIEELRKWHFFDEFDPTAKAASDKITNGKYSSLPPWLQAKLEDGNSSEGYDSPSTIQNAEPHVGRNSPCPCGSGKKFKKCCGGRHLN